MDETDDIATKPIPLSYGHDVQGLLVVRIARAMIVVLGAMLLCTIVFAVLWGCFVEDVLYHCTDSIGFGYISGPEHWVHGTVAGQPGDYGDTIEPGWTFGRLKLLWVSMIAMSVVVSLGCAWYFDRLTFRRVCN